jgi:tetratricopeptide (TPR) repeat protein
VADQPQDIVKKADQLRLSGSYDQARALLEQLIQQNPFFAPAKLSLGRVHFESGDLATAKSVLEEFAEFVPDHSLANKILAKIYIYFSQTDKAREKINSVLAISPDDSMAKKMLVELDESDSFQEASLNDEDTKKNTAPTNTATIAEIYRGQGHLKEALSIYKELSAQNPDHSGYKQKIHDIESELHPEKTSAEVELEAADEPLQQESSIPEFKRMEITQEKEISINEMSLNETVELEQDYQQPIPTQPSEPQIEAVQPAADQPFRKTRQEKLERMLYLVQQHRRG